MQEQASMQEMLKRKNLVTNGSAFTMQAPEMPMPTAAASAMSQARSGGAPMNKNVPEALLAAQGQGNPIAGGAPDIQHDPEAAAQSLAESNTDPSVVAALEGLGVLAAGTAAAYATYRAMKNKGGVPLVEGELIDPATGQKRLPAPIPEGEFTEVHALGSPDPRQQHPSNPTNSYKTQTPRQAAGEAIRRRAAQGKTGKGTVTPPSGTRQLTDQSSNRRATAEALQERAAKGSPSDVGTIRGEPPIRTITEPVDAGVGRTLGVPQEVIKMLKANPGLAKLIGRGL